MGKVYGLPADWFVLTEFEVLLAVFLLLLGVDPLSQGLFLTCPSHLQWLQVNHSMCLFVGVKRHFLTTEVISRRCLLVRVELWPMYCTLEYTILHTQDMAAQPATVYRPVAVLSVDVCTSPHQFLFHESSPQCGFYTVMHYHPGKWNLNPLQQYQKG